MCAAVVLLEAAAFEGADIGGCFVGPTVPQLKTTASNEPFIYLDVPVAGL